MTKEKKQQRTGRLLFTGFSMGFADLIPGVSSGTIAFLYGIYQELLYTIRTITGKVPKLVLKGKIVEAWKLIPFSFIIPLGVGMVVAIFSLVQLVSFLLETQTVFIWSVFFGLVLGSVFVIRKRMSGWTWRRVALLLAGLIITTIIVTLPQANIGNSPLITLGTGAIASMAMILPGISGSLMMVLLGQYEYIINAISTLDIVTLVIFATGIIIGLAAFARLLSWLLHHHHSAVIATLIGVMLGSLAAIWPWQSLDSSLLLPAVDLGLALALTLMAAGFALVFVLEKAGIAKEHTDDLTTKDFKSELKTQED